jgi:hypothetical protein
MRPPRWIVLYHQGARPVCGVLAIPEPWTFRWVTEAFSTRPAADRFLRDLARQEARRAWTARSPGLFHAAHTEVTGVRLTWRGDVVQDGFAEMLRAASTRVEREARQETAEALRLLKQARRTA